VNIPGKFKTFGLLSFGFLLWPWVTVHAQPSQLIFWHNQTGLQARFVEKLIDEFNSQHPGKVKIWGETGLELESTLMSRINPSVRPDLLLIPSDMTGLKEELQLTHLPSSWTRLSQGTRLAPESFGIPVLGGNQLYLFYNKRLITEVPTTWLKLQQLHEQLKKTGVRTIGWPFYEPYYFLPFIQAFGQFDPERLETPEMKLALDFYRDLIVSGIVPKDCDLSCNTKRFYNGEFAFAISGDWGITEAKAKLKEQFGMAPLPGISATQPLISGSEIQYLVFPKRRSFEKHQKLLKEFSHFLLSEPVQARWFKEADRVPILSHLDSKLSNIATIAKPVPRTKTVFYSWIALRKGLQLLMAGENGIPGKMQKHLGTLQRSEAKHP